jgi:hypothetical protein
VIKFTKVGQPIHRLTCMAQNTHISINIALDNPWLDAANNCIGGIRLLFFLQTLALNGNPESEVDQV